MKIKIHSFDIEDAEKYGIEKAVILYNLKFWLDKNLANNKNIKDNEVWTYNSTKAWAKLFPYFSEDKIYRLLKSMEEENMIISGNYNIHKYDRTKWYSIPKYYKIHSADMQNGFYESAEPIPDINTNINKDNLQDTNFSTANAGTKPKLNKNLGLNTLVELYKTKGINLPNIIFSNNTERASANELLKSKGIEKISNMLDYCISLQNETKQEDRRYLHRFDTPHQLLKNYEIIKMKM